MLKQLWSNNIEKLIPLIIHNALKKKLPIYGNGKQTVTGYVGDHLMQFKIFYKGKLVKFITSVAKIELDLVKKFIILR